MADAVDETQAKNANATTLWRLATLILFFNGLLALWLIFKPAAFRLVVDVDNIAEFVGPLLVLPLCFQGFTRPAHGGGATATKRWSPFLLGLAILSFATGQAIVSYYVVVLHQIGLLPPLADIAFLLTYPCVLLSILLLPARPLPAATRPRLVLDGLMMITAVITFSWYFILGPTLLQAHVAIEAKLVGTIAPSCDLIVIFCLLRLGAQATDEFLRLTVRLLALALCVIVLSDSVLEYQLLHGAYTLAGLVDVGWPLGVMLAGLSMKALHQALDAQADVEHDRESHREEADVAQIIPLWRDLLPYIFVPAVAALLIYMWHQHGAAVLTWGATFGGMALLGVVLLRQVLAIMENRYLYRRVTAANVRLQALATTDPLTELPNHRAMVAALDHELERAQRYSRPCAVLFMDLDDFKKLNDIHGHLAGDTALRDIAQTVRQTLRTVDTVGRWGGEEFVILLPEMESAGALYVAERVRAAVAHHTLAPIKAHLTCSIGTAAYPGDGDDRNELIAAADKAMYVAKMLGRNQVRGADDPAVLAFSGLQPQDMNQESTLTGMIETLAALVQARDQYTGEHTFDVATLASQLAAAIGLNAADTRLIQVAGRLHDVGKVAIPDAILQKATQLTDEEWELMRQHPALGADLVANVPALRVLAPLIRAHHERWDGGGYPDGLVGENIPLGARIIAVADTYEAIITNRPYRLARSAEWAIGEIERCSGTQFDPAIVEALMRILTSNAHDTSRAG